MSRWHANEADARRSNYLQETFSYVGLNSGNTSLSTYAHVQPSRSPGTETIILSANWISKDGGPNLRGVATALALGDYLKGMSSSFDIRRELISGQNYWAFDIVIVIGEGYLEGLENFMQSYHSLFSGIIWTGLNVDYPGHSFSHLGLFYGKFICSPITDKANICQRVRMDDFRIRTFSTLSLILLDTRLGYKHEFTISTTSLIGNTPR